MKVPRAKKKKNNNNNNKHYYYYKYLMITKTDDDWNSKLIMLLMQMLLLFILYLKYILLQALNSLDRVWRMNMIETPRRRFWKNPIYWNFVGLSSHVITQLAWARCVVGLIWLEEKTKMCINIYIFIIIYIIYLRWFIDVLWRIVIIHQRNMMYLFTGKFHELRYRLP